MKIKFFSYLCITLFLLGCNQDNEVVQEKTINFDSVIAKYNGGVITIGDIENHLKTLPVNDRWNTEDTIDWYKSKVKIFSINKKLTDDALKSNIKDTKNFKLNKRAIERNALSNYYINSNFETKQITDQNILNYYQNNISLYQYPEERLVHHIFKRIDDKNTEKSVILQLENLKNRVISGENFSLLAKEYSESESRHKNGFIGKFALTENSNKFIKIAFSLKKQIPSNPIKSGNGYHIFYVSEILEKHTTSLQEVKSSIFTHLKQVQYNENLTHLINEIKEKPVYKIITLKELDDLNSGVTKNEILFQVGNYSLDYLELKNELVVYNDISRKLNAHEITIDRINKIAFREIIYQTQNSQGLKFPNSNQINDTKNILLLNLYKDKLMNEYIVQQNKELKEYFNKNRNQFYSQPIFNIEFLKVNKSNTNIMTLLEKKVEKLNNQEMTFKELSKEIGEKIQYLESISDIQLKLYKNSFYKVTHSLNEGQFSHPFTDKDSAYVIKLINKVNGIPQEFMEINDKVLEAYKLENYQNIILKISKNILEELNIEFNDKKIEQYIQDPSVVF